ncbi:hypothetical protein BDV23DRAFT_156962 [Aspergillus alliaceus]|uniref:Uncharacterized protein n=1 Tax=Petromyces alliaceus TaxID=209559 RepID=A0A5N7C6B5_PETAA|nr:hypothetical protein BDV23DRAFT_156962 [Aspergillus alliaceus]
MSISTNKILCSPSRRRRNRNYTRLLNQQVPVTFAQAPRGLIIILLMPSDFAS